MSLLLRRYHSQDELVSEEIETQQPKAKAKTKAKKSGDVDGEAGKD